jgi:hypothetical protein
LFESEVNSLVQEAEMGTLMFECPATGMEVSTGIEVDTTSFQSLSPTTADLSCPHCPNPHPMHAVRTWLAKTCSALHEGDAHAAA